MSSGTKKETEKQEKDEVDGELERGGWEGE